jgi:hypothetical protein
LEGILDSGVQFDLSHLVVCGCPYTIGTL